MTNKNSSESLSLMLGLAAKAGKLVFGTFLVCKALAETGKGKPCAVFEASDTSENTGKRLSDKCLFYGVRHEVLPIDMKELSRATGKRALISAVGVCDENLAKAISEKLKAQHSPPRATP